MHSSFMLTGQQDLYGVGLKETSCQVPGFYACPILTSSFQRRNSQLQQQHFCACHLPAAHLILARHCLVEHKFANGVTMW